jgi:teichuronic acid biosynthesis glycosyltransferase TuaG
MVNQQPLVSVLLIAMNHEKFIEQACKSIVNQSYRNVEVIFLDNNSSDQTFEIADRFFKHTKINYIGIKNSENKGVSENLNILVANANGEYVSILSGDDWYEDANIESRFYFLLKNDLDVVLADGFKFIEDKQEKKDVYSNKRKQKVIQTIQDYYNVNLVNNITCNVGFFTKREILSKHKFDEQVYAEDWDINLRLSKEGYKFGFLDRKTFNYRILNTSLSHNVDLMRKSFLKVTEKYQSEIDSNSNHRDAYNMRLIEFDIIDLKQNPNKTKFEIEKLKKLQFQLHHLKYKGIKRIFKNILLYFKNY